MRKILKSFRIRVKDLSIILGMSEQGIVRWKHSEVPKHIAEYMDILTRLSVEERDKYLTEKLIGNS